MILFARILATLAAIFGIGVGLGFMLDPAKYGAMFFLTPNGVPGLAVLRADMTAFFLVSGILSAVAAWTKAPSLLIAPIMLYATAIVGRTISLIVDGNTPGAFTPMIVEAALVSGLWFARRTFSGSLAHG